MNELIAWIKEHPEYSVVIKMSYGNVMVSLMKNGKKLDRIILEQELGFAMNILENMDSMYKNYEANNGRAS